ncbi:TPA: glycosyltransferase family 9 protein, partial [Pasteurella multocida]|nr:glycosyltransferase family 9 protein [Pasteurella multocida]
NKDIFHLSYLVDELIDNTFVAHMTNRKKWDLYLDFQPTFTSKSIILEKILSPKYILIFSKKNKKSYNTSTINNYNYHCKVPLNTHISDYLKYTPLHCFIDDKDNKYILNTVNKSHDKYWKNNKIRILISPQGSNRHIPEEEIASLINNIGNNIKTECSFLLSLTKEKENYLSKIKENMSSPINITLLPDVSLSEYLNIVNSSDLVISVDSGTVHIACALSKKLLAFYANDEANLNKWFPKMPMGTPYKVVINISANNSNDTSNFPLNEASHWLQEQLQQISISKV